MAQASRPLRRRRDYIAEARTHALRIAAIFLTCCAIAYPIAEGGIAAFRWWFGL